MLGPWSTSANPFNAPDTFESSRISGVFCPTYQATPSSKSPGKDRNGVQCVPAFMVSTSPCSSALRHKEPSEEKNHSAEPEVALEMISGGFIPKNTSSVSFQFHSDDFKNFLKNFEDFDDRGRNNRRFVSKKNIFFSDLN